ncbi:MAG: flagellar motor switch phosphatase FliY [Bacillota bacterium]
MNKDKQVLENDEMLLDSLEIDTIGEILNISMGAAATAISTMLDRQVSITTPTVECIKTDDFDFQELEPADGVEIEYIEGLHGSNYLIMKRKDVRTIVELLMGEGLSESEEELDELHVSALSEIMNQMMGSSSTALAEFFGKSINISTPRRFDAEKVREKITLPGYGGYIVRVSFIFKVEGLIDSAFCTVLPVSFTKELVRSAMDMGSEDGAMPEPETEPGNLQEDYADGEDTEEEYEEYEDGYEEEPEYLAAREHHNRIVQKMNVQPFKLLSFDNNDGSIDNNRELSNLGLIMDVPLQITVEIGRAKKLIKEILELEQGSVVEMDKQAGDSVDVIVNGRLMARGDVVVIDDNFGVRITEIVSTKEIFKFL